MSKTNKDKTVKGISSKTAPSNPFQNLDIPTRPSNLKNHDMIHEFYLSLKSTAIELEGDNHRYIILYHRNENFWQIGGYSLLFYQHHLQKLHNLPEIHIRHDNDFTVKWPHQTCAFIRQIDNFCLALETKAHAARIFEHPELLIFELPQPYSDSDLKNFSSIAKNKELQFNRLVGIKHVDAVTGALIMQLHREILNRVNKFPEIYRVHHGNKIIDLSLGMVSSFNEMAFGRYKETAFYYDAVRSSEQILSWLVIVHGLKLIDVDSSIRIADLTINLRNHVARGLERVQNRMAQEKQQRKRN